MLSKKKSLVCGIVVVASVLICSADDEGVSFLGVTNSYGQAYCYAHLLCSSEQITKFGINPWDSYDGKNAEPPVETGYWNALADGRFWSDGQVPSSDKIYKTAPTADTVARGIFVPCSPNGSTVTFSGKKLVMGTAVGSDARSSGYYGDVNAAYFVGDGGKTVFENDGVDFVYGGFYAKNMNSTLTFSGKFNVLSPKTIPWWIGAAYGNYNLTFDESSPFSGEATTGMRVFHNGGQGTTIVKFLGDMSAYYGDISCEALTTIVFGGAAVDFSGSLKLSDTAVLSLSHAGKKIFKVGTMDASSSASPAILGLGISGDNPLGLDDARGLRVETALMIADGIRPTVSYGTALLPYLGSAWQCQTYNTTARTYTVLDVPDMGVSLFDQFDLSEIPLTINYNYILGFSASVVPQESVANGRRTISIDIPKATYMTEAGKSKFDGKTLTPFESGNGDAWYGQTVMDGFDAGTVYTLSPGGNYVLPSSAYTFPGKALIQPWSCSLKQYADFTADYVLPGNSKHIISKDTPMTLAGRIFVSRYPTNGQELNEDDGRYRSDCVSEIWGKASLLTLSADIIGDAIIIIRNDRWENAKTDVNVALTGDNVRFAGKLKVLNGQAANGNITTVCVGSAKNLGGRLVAFRYDAIGVDDGGRLQATDSFEISEPTRGICFGNSGRVCVDENKQLTLGTTTTYDGELVKEGAGVLALKGPRKFTVSQSDALVAGKNILTVNNGCVKGLSKLATDGLKVKFAEGTSIRLSAPDVEKSTDEQAYGFYNVNGSFDLTATDGKLKVTLDEAENLPESFSLAVCTVKEKGFTAGDISIKAPRKYRVASVTSATANGETTFTANFERSGTVITIR